MRGTNTAIVGNSFTPKIRIFDVIRNPMKSNIRATLSILTLALPLCLLVQVSSAVTIDFEGANAQVLVIGDSFDIGDIRFTMSGGHTGRGFLEASPAWDVGIVESGNRKLVSANFAEVTITRVDGGIFDVTNIDIGGFHTGFLAGWANHVDISDGSSTVTANLLGQGNTYLNVSVSFLNATSVTFTPFHNIGSGPDSNNYNFTIDNIVVDEPVPDTGSTALLLGAGLLGLAAIRRRFGRS